MQASIILLSICYIALAAIVTQFLFEISKLRKNQEELELKERKLEVTFHDYVHDNFKRRVEEEAENVHR